MSFFKRDDLFKSEPEPIPEGKYRTIVADPPWDYKGANVGGKYNITKGGIKIRKHHGVSELYPSMSLDEICNLPIKDLADKNAHLYLWTTNAFMVAAHEVAEAWGFKVKTILTWGKVKADGKTPSMKLGNHFRSSTEHCLFCIRGKLRTTRTPNRPTLYLSGREAHSVKPAWFYRIVEEQSPGPYLELFARRKRPGWSVWGNQV